jgi:hypothetical protein
VSTINLPVGYARDVYCYARARGKSQSAALAKASEVDACPEDFVCAKCQRPVECADHLARVRVKHRKDGDPILEVHCHSCMVAALQESL